MHIRWHPFSLEGWERKETYLGFLDYPVPYLVIGANVPLRGSYDQVKAPFLWTVHCVTRAANEVSAFRMRIRNRDLILHERVHPSFTVPHGKEAFGIRRAAFQPDFETFQAEASQAVARPFAPGQDKENDDHWIFLSCMPWICFTHVVQPISPVTASIPRVIWGRASRDELPVSVQVHHSLVDGLHVGQFLQLLESYLTNPKST